MGGGAEPNSMITLFGNAWKAYKLSDPYPVTRNTRLEFIFTLMQEAEGHAICLDRDVNEDTFGGARVRCLMVGGTQFAEWDHVMKTNLLDHEEVSGAYKSYRVDISISDLFPEMNTDITYIGFIQDNDSDPLSGESAFQAIRLYDDDITIIPLVSDCSIFGAAALESI